MSAIVGILMAVRSLTIMAGFMSADSSIISFTQPLISVEQSKINVTVSLNNAINDEIKKMINAGTTIPLFLYLEFESDIKSGITPKIQHMNLLQYSPANSQYVMQNHLGSQTFFRTIDSAIINFTQFKNVHLCPLSFVNKERSYVIKLQSLLGETKMDALGGSTFDLMYYWDYKRPSLKTDPIPGNLFLYRRQQ